MMPPPPALIGRENEAEEVAEMLAAAEAAPGRRRAPRRGGHREDLALAHPGRAAAAAATRVLSSRPPKSENGSFYAGLADLLAGVIADVLPELPPIQQRALEGALLLGESEVQAGERAVGAAFLASLKVLASTTPLCARDRRRAVARRGVAARFGSSSDDCATSRSPYSQRSRGRAASGSGARRRVKARRMEVGTLSIGATRNCSRRASARASHGRR